jgi:hypothetical protein
MALPFPITTPRDLLSKAKRELDSLNDEAEGLYHEPNEVALADLTINAAWSLWHVTDWIAGHRDARAEAIVAGNQGPGPTRAQRFQRHLRRRSTALRLC